MDIPVEQLWAMPEAELVAAYHKMRRDYAEKKFARDTERGRLQWHRARTFVTGKGGVTERMNAVDASEELAKKGQHVRELTLELDLVKCDIDAITATLRMRGAGAFPLPRGEGEMHAEEEAGPYESGGN